LEKKWGSKGILKKKRGLRKFKVVKKLRPRKKKIKRGNLIIIGPSKKNLI